MKIKRLILTTTILCLCVGGAAKADVIIDHFDDFDSNPVTTNVDSTEWTVNANGWGVTMLNANFKTVNEIGLDSSALGGKRYTELDFAGVDPTRSGTGASMRMFASEYAHFSGEEGWVTRMTYAGDGIGGTSWDLTEGGINDVIEVAMEADNLHTPFDDAGMSITLTDSLANTYTVTTGFTDVDEGYLNYYYFDLADFTGVTLSSIDTVSWELVGISKTDAEIDYIKATAVPEPATMSLIGLGVISSLAGALRRRRS